MKSLTDVLREAETELERIERHAVIYYEDEVPGTNVLRHLVDVLRVMVGDCSTGDSGERGASIEYGWVVPRGLARDRGYQVDICEKTAIDSLVAQAAAALAPGTRFEIRRAIPSNYGRSKALAWFSAPAMADDAAWDSWHPGHVPEGGYYLVERRVTPEAAAS